MTLIKRISIIACADILICLLATSCYYDNTEELYPLPEEPDTITTFSDDIQPIILTRCATSPGCHASGSSYPVLETYDEISSQITRIEARALDQGTMPPSSSPQLSSKQKAELETWIADGFPNN